MNREEAIRVAEELIRSPAAQWIGNKVIDGGKRLLQRCMRCRAEQTLTLPRPLVDFDETLYAWKRKFQIAHENCIDGGAAA